MQQQIGATSRIAVAVRAALLALLLLSLSAAPALAGAGDGTASFSSGGSGSGEDWLAKLELWVLISPIVIVALIVTGVVGLVRRRKRRRRAKRVERAAVTVAVADPLFATDAVTAVARALYLEVQAAYDARDDARLAAVLMPQPLAELRARLAELAARGDHHCVTQVVFEGAEYLGLVDREGHDRDEILVRVSAEVHDHIEHADGTISQPGGRSARRYWAREWWTLAKRPDGSGWWVASIERDEQAGHQLLNEPIVTA
ncbi:TIM44-like domain-containing protein [Conexibacter sp. JD483]|uniref:TIM44-like domain-containing protein n=1 Tax=unclassified Conexibacter TaxID=2627773 RepID=UPI002722C201|nr:MULTISPECIES: TIM44-like domain-containing protein [unclassified Conexibacter]MDO8188991.1 TIM44-like domain-containing protein [Conexibacter sp. CPCC 205706]MDO8201797.1 TIM44-like domain-containing protein [Conexibacter sp. CPCC 205762]MDR9371514.1 TIM44-like domain-containing protein [Conexibacter sp. JD483]